MEGLRNKSVKRWIAVLLIVAMTITNVPGTFFGGLNKLLGTPDSKIVSMAATNSSASGSDSEEGGGDISIATTSTASDAEYKELGGVEKYVSAIRLANVDEDGLVADYISESSPMFPGEDYGLVLILNGKEFWQTMKSNTEVKNGVEFRLKVPDEIYAFSDEGFDALIRRTEEGKAPLQGSIHDKDNGIDIETSIWYTYDNTGKPEVHISFHPQYFDTEEITAAESYYMPIVLTANEDLETYPEIMEDGEELDEEILEEIGEGSNAELDETITVTRRRLSASFGESIRKTELLLGEGGVSQYEVESGVKDFSYLTRFEIKDNEGNEFTPENPAEPGDELMARWAFTIPDAELDIVKREFKKGVIYEFDMPEKLYEMLAQDFEDELTDMSEDGSRISPWTEVKADGGGAAFQWRLTENGVIQLQFSKLDSIYGISGAMYMYLNINADWNEEVDTIKYVIGEAENEAGIYIKEHVDFDVKKFAMLMDDQYKKVWWVITVNISDQNKTLAGVAVEDQFVENEKVGYGYLDTPTEEHFIVTLGMPSGGKVLDVDYIREGDAENGKIIGFRYVFPEDTEPGNKTLCVQTDFIDNVKDYAGNQTLINEVSATDKKGETKKDTEKIDIPSGYGGVNVGKTGKLITAEKGKEIDPYILWTITVSPNSNTASYDGVVITDTLAGRKDNLDLEHPDVSLTKNGVEVQRGEEKGEYQLVTTGNNAGFTYQFPDGAPAEKTTFVFKTPLKKEAYDTAGNYEITNKAKAEKTLATGDNRVDNSPEAKVKIEIEYLKKNSNVKVICDDATKKPIGELEYYADINRKPGGAMNGFTIVDKYPSGTAVIPESIKIVSNPETGGIKQKDLIKDSDFTVKVNETENKFTIKCEGTIEGPYRLTYRLKYDPALIGNLGEEVVDAKTGTTYRKIKNSMSGDVGIGNGSGVSIPTMNVESKIETNGLINGLPVKKEGTALFSWDLGSALHDLNLSKEERGNLVQWKITLGKKGTEYSGPQTLVDQVSYSQSAKTKLTLLPETVKIYRADGTENTDVTVEVVEKTNERPGKNEDAVYYEYILNGTIQGGSYLQYYTRVDRVNDEDSGIRFTTSSKGPWIQITNTVTTEDDVKSQKYVDWNYQKRIQKELIGKFDWDQQVFHWKIGLNSVYATAPGNFGVYMDEPVLTDTLSAGQKLAVDENGHYQIKVGNSSNVNDGSFKQLYTREQLQAEGKTKSEQWYLSDITELSGGRQQFTIELNPDCWGYTGYITNAFWFLVDTSPDLSKAEPGKTTTYSNTAEFSTADNLYVPGDDSTRATAQGSLSTSQSLSKGTFTLSREETEQGYVGWQIVVNQNLVSDLLVGAVLEDSLAEGIELVTGSVEFYQAQTSGGKLKEPLALGAKVTDNSITYDYDLTDRKLSVSFTDKIERGAAYIVRFKTRTTNSSLISVKNKATLTGLKEGEPEESNEVSAAIKYGGYIKCSAYKISVQKKGEDGKGLQGAKFRVYRNINGGGQEEFFAETDEYGIGVFKNSVGQENIFGPYQYYMQETEAPEGYYLDETVQKLTVNEQTADGDGGFVFIVNHQSYEQSDVARALRMTKLDAVAKNGVANAEFALIKAGGSGAEAETLTHFINKNGVYWYDRVNGSVMPLITDAYGEITVKGLPAGTYYFEEQKAAPGYVLPETVEERRTEMIVLEETLPKKAKSNNEYVVETKKAMLNNRQEGVVQFTKTDDETGTVLFGAEFKVIQKRQENGLGKTFLNLVGMNEKEIVKFRIDKESTGSDQVTVDENGLVTIRGLEWNTEYILRETKAPEGYMLGEHPIEKEFTIGYDVFVNQGGILKLGTIENHKIGTAVITITAAKELTGRDLKAGEFTFELRGKTNELIGTAKNTADGTITFDEIKYDYQDIGVHSYFISEVIGDEEGITYDTTDYPVEITVSMNQKTGELKAVQTGPETAAVFKNTYEGNTQIVLTADKMMNGRPLTANEFTFQLKTKAGELISEAVNDENGRITFPVIVYHTKDAGIHQYTISEKAGNEEGVTYDSTVYPVTVTVTADEHTGEVKAEISNKEKAAVFRNSYYSSTSVTLEAVKTLTGRDLKAGEFEFELRNHIGDKISSAKNQKDGKIVFDPIRYEIGDAGKTYEYQIAEVAGNETGITYDTNVYKVFVKVTADDRNKLSAEVTLPKEVLTFQNTYKSTETDPTKPDESSTVETTTETETTTAPETTVIPETTTAPETTVIPETTTAPETTVTPETTTAPETTVTPETTGDSETTVAPETSTEQESTSTSESIVTPETPGSGGNSGNGSGEPNGPGSDIIISGGSTGTGGGPGEGLVQVEDEPVPLATILDELVPLAGLPNLDTPDDLVEIDDGDVPLAGLPKLGDNGALAAWAFMMASLMAGIGLTATRKKKK